MKNILPGTLRKPQVEVSFGSFNISREKMLRIIHFLNYLITGRK